MSLLPNNEFETVDEAYNEVLRIRGQRDMIAKEMIEVLCMVRTGATKEQIDFRLRNALAAIGSMLVPEK